MKQNRNSVFFFLLLLCVIFAMCVSCEGTQEDVEAETETVSSEYVYTNRYFSVPQTADTCQVGYYVTAGYPETTVSARVNDAIQLYYYAYETEEAAGMREDEDGNLVETGVVHKYEILQAFGTAVFRPNDGGFVLEPFPFGIQPDWGEEEKRWLTSETALGGFAQNEKGELAIIAPQSMYDEKTHSSYPIVTVVYYNADGSVKYVVKAEDYPGMEGYDEIHVNEFVYLTEDGYLFFLNRETLVVLDPDGNYVKHERIAPYKGVHPFIEMHRANDGTVFIIYMNREDRTMWYVTVDPVTWEVSAHTALPLPEGTYGSSQNYAFYTKEIFFFNDGVAVYRSDFSGNREKLFSWLDFGVVGADIDAFYARDEHNFYVISHDLLTYAPEILTIDYVPVDTIPKKTELVIACGADSSSAMKKLQTAVTLFNRQSDTYKAKILAYDPDKESGFTINQQIANDMANGTRIDLILFQEDITMEYFDNLGILGDWYPYMDADADYTRDKFLPCILRAYETTDGTLPVLTTDFGLTTLIGARENLAFMEQWTYSDCMTYLKTLDWDQLLLQLDKEKGENQSDAMLVFRSFLPMVLDDYIDEDTGTCTFDSESFRQLLTLCTEVMINHEAAALKYADGAEEIVWEGMGYLREYRQGKTLLYNQRQNLNHGKNSIEHPSDMMNVLLNFFSTYEGEITAIGYPMPDGTTEHGTAVTPHIQFGLTASAEHAEGAWAFLKTYLDYQNDRRQEKALGVTALPCTKRALDALYDAYLTYEYLASGTPWLQEYADDFSRSENSPLYHDADPRACDLLDDLLAQTTRRYSGNTAIMNILYEEAVYFFDGIQPMEEVTKRMQSRVGIYLSEHQ